MDKAVLAPGYLCGKSPTIIIIGAGKMAQWLIALAPFSEVQFPTLTW